MAQGILKATGATLGLSITGIAGPTGGTEDKPVGLVHFALSDGKKTETVERRFSGPRQRIREFATQQALDMVRRKLL
jgi:nicotinamide-nucleotide amidase